MSPITALPQATLTADGAPLPAEALAPLSSVRVQQRLSLPTLCELVFSDPPGPLDIAAQLPLGAQLRVGIAGYPDALFVGEVTAVEYLYGAGRGNEVHIRAYDRLHRLRKRQAVRAHVQVNVRDLARDLAGDLGLSVEAADAGPVWPRLIQHRQSDLELLTEVAEQCGLYLSLRDEVLHLLTLEGIGASIPLALGRSLWEAHFEATGEAAWTSVTASGWNPLRVEAYTGRASAPRVGRQVEAENWPNRVGGDERTLPHEAAGDTRHAEAIAQGELDRRVAYGVTFWGVAQGDPLLRPGTRVDVEGVDSSMAGQYVLTAVTHTLDRERGFVSELSTTPPAPTQREPGAFVAYGVVTRVDDPDRLGRIQVSLPTYNNVETGWMHVVSPGAGPHKGLMALPDVGDQVLVLLSHGDPGQGVVLGGLYGMQGPEDSGVEGQAVRRYLFHTPGGQRVRLDDVRQTIRLENSDGSYVELTPDKVRIHAARDLEIEAPGRSIVIRGQAIDFQRG